MNGDPEKFEELERLLSALHDATASRADTARIENLLRGDPEACEFYLDYSQLCADTDLECSFRQSIEVGRKTVPLDIAKTTSLFFRGQTTKQILNPSWKPLPWFAAAAGLMLVAGTIAFLSGKKNPLATAQVKATEAAELSIDNGVAILMGTVDASFGSGSLQPLKTGGILPLGELRLESGIAEIEFYSGTRIILEGPSALDLTSENSATLIEGRIRAQIPGQAHGFILRTPQLEIIDRIGEFGVNIEEDGHLTEIHCFEGEVAIHEPPTNKKAKLPRILKPGEALRIQVNGTRKIEANSMAFVSYADIAYTALENATLRHQKWSHLIERMRADAHVLALYTFEDQGPRERQLVNQAAYKEMFTHGAIIGCRWTNGRWPSKGALEFSRASDRVKVDANGTHEAVTLSAWIRLDAFPKNRQAQVSLLSSNQKNQGAIEWTLRRDGKINFAIQANSKKSINYSSPVVLGSGSIYKWHHLVAIYDTAQGSVQHFFNGNKIANLPIHKKTAFNVILDGIEIGNSEIKLPNGKRPVRNLTGRIDELSVFGRPLDTGEITEIYQAGIQK